MDIADSRITKVLDELSSMLDPEDIQLLLQYLQQNPGRELEALYELQGLTYERKPVSVREFIESPEYLNMKGQVYPVLLDDLEELFSGDYMEAVLTGGIGYGKCIAGDAKITTQTGEVMLADFHTAQQKARVYGWSKEGGYTLATAQGSKCSGKKDVVCLKLTDKKQLTLTPDHQVFTPRGWLPVNTLNPGFEVGTIRNGKLKWVAVESISPAGTAEVYDLDIPELRNFVANGIIVHNSTFSSIALIRMVYEASCLRNPQAVYGLVDNAVIAFVNVSINKDQAKEVVFQDVKSKLRNSPYFTSVFPYDKDLKEEMRFPKDIWIAPVTNPIGYNVFGAVIDEINFFDVIEKSRRAVGGKYDRAQDVHDNLIRRMKSRFMRKGKLPGILLSVSSARYPTDFTERMIEQAQDDPTIFWRRYAQWETKPKSYFIGDYFKVCIGSSAKRAFVIEDGIQQEKAGELGLPIIAVPIEYKNEFIMDIDGAIRDLAGYPTVTIHPFIQNRSKVFDAADRGTTAGFVHPYSVEATTLQDGAGFIKNLLHPTEHPRYIHCDLALSGDSAGFGMGHVSSWIELVRKNNSGEDFKVSAPVITIDVLLRIVPPADGEIQIDDVRALIYELQSYGFRIAKVTFDQFQSAESIQQLNRRKINAERLSIDSKPECYNATKEALYEDRLVLYDYPPVIEELLQLEKNEKNGRIDHPPRGCFVGETRVPLLDGTCPTIAELAGKENMWVYSARPDGSIVPGKAKGFLSKYATELVDVVLDSGAVIRCTPEHPWMLRDGQYKQAKDLRPGIDRLMSATQKFSQIQHTLPITLDTPIPVYDLEVAEWHNFALSAGVFVHNSKDCADALAGVCYHCTTQKPPAIIAPMLGELVSPVDDKNIQSAVDTQLSMFGFTPTLTVEDLLWGGRDL